MNEFQMIKEPNEEVFDTLKVVIFLLDSFGFEMKISIREEIECATYKLRNERDYRNYKLNTAIFKSVLKDTHLGSKIAKLPELWM